MRHVHVRMVLHDDAFLAMWEPSEGGERGVLMSDVIASVLDDHGDEHKTNVTRCCYMFQTKYAGGT